MSDVITLSSEDEKDSDVEIIGSYSHFRTDTEPLSEVRVDVDALNVNVPTHYIDLKDPRWTFPELKLGKRKKSSSLVVIDLTENNIVCETKPLNDFQTSNQLHPNSHHCIPTVTFKQLPFLDTLVKEHVPSALSKDCAQMSVNITLPGGASKTLEGTTTTSSGPSLDHTHPRKTESSVRQEQDEEGKKRNESIIKHLNEEISQGLETPGYSDRGTNVTDTREQSITEDAMDCFSDVSFPYQSPPFTRGVKDHFEKKDSCTDLQQLKPDKSEPGPNYLSAHSSCGHPVIELIPPEPNDIESQCHTAPLSESLMSWGGPASTSEQAPAENTSEQAPAENTSEQQLKEVKTDEASSSSDLLGQSNPHEPLVSVFKAEGADGGFRSVESGGDLESYSPVSCIWVDECYEVENTESTSNMNFREASEVDRRFVCPVTLKKLMSRQALALNHDGFKDLRSPELLCPQSLIVVYSTIDEKYTEGTLQLLSDLLQPGYYPPKDITFHLLHGILLDPQCPYHLCVQAFDLLMRTQRHHMADKITVPWDWERLSTVMASQDQTQKHRTEVIRMLLEYVVQTLEDDFQAKYTSSNLHFSIAKATLSCDQQFPQVRDVIKWLFSAIKKSTEGGEGPQATKKRNEQSRMVSILQRMLSLALEVDRSPALTSAKLSQELFHMLIGNVPLRAHRMLLLESMQSKLLRCKLLEHLLDYACPPKIPLPMSLRLLLHFLENCTLTPDPADGAEKWKKWQELVQLIWMLLLSYNKAMKGYLSSSASDQRNRVGTRVYKQDDIITKPAVRDAVEAFLSRSKADLGQALPLHVEESLTYLQDYLLDVCQC